MARYVNLDYLDLDHPDEPSHHFSGASDNGDGIGSYLRMIADNHMVRVSFILGEAERLI